VYWRSVPLTPQFGELLSRFTGAFHVSLNPIVLMVRDDARVNLAKVEPLASFRDVVALCVVPYSRSLSLVNRSVRRVSYSNSFWLYPWMLGQDNEHLIASTPALQGLHLVERFNGQSSAELSIMELNDVDEPLLQALLLRWKRHYPGKRQRWNDRALFRSLNMAFHAAQLPAGIDTNLYDLGRIAALWVSAFEILAHPRTSGSGPNKVHGLLESVPYLDRNVRCRRYAVGRKKPKKPRLRRSLPCWFYDKLYVARCDFLHGNPVGTKTLHPGSKASLFWLAPCLYRLALTGFLGLSFKRKPPKKNDPREASEYAVSRIRFERYQARFERALLQTRK
jgi:hypothetical protein